MLYEVFTGHRAFPADSAAGYLEAHQRSAPPSPSTHIRTLDPGIERVVLRCLEKDPALRPASALEVAAALPGADPLRAALAAGETPSPEMVAAAGQQIRMRPAIAAGALAALALSLLALLVISPQIGVFTLAGLEDPPQVLARKARDISAAVGYPGRPADTWMQLHLDPAYLDHVAASLSADTWDTLAGRRPSPARVSYRESPVPLRSWRTNGGGRVTLADPPATVPGMIALELDGAGRLRRFDAVPLVTADASAESAAFDPGLLFKLAGLEPSDFGRAEPSVTPVAYGEHSAWTGTYPGQPTPPIRLDMSVADGRLLHFSISEPWTRAEVVRTAGDRGQAIFVTALLSSVLIGAAWLAWGNIRRGRGDRRGAFRLAAFIACVSLLAWLLRADHVPTIEERLVLAQALKDALLQAAFIWLLYLALEPYVRRRWPETLIAWSRLLEGKVRDPLVARDLLLGLVAGVALQALTRMAGLLDRDAAVRFAGDVAVAPLSSLGDYVGWIVDSLLFVEIAMGLFFLMVIARVILRREWLAAVALLLLVAVPGFLQQQPLVALGVTLLYVGVMYALAIRVGLVALAASMCTGHVLSVPLTADPDAWFAGYSYALAGLLLAVGTAAFYVAKAGQPLVRTELLE
ncbi:hypothetical protein BH24ACI5_BH24ACI5_13430 [soil metagenome]